MREVLSEWRHARSCGEAADFETVMLASRLFETEELALHVAGLRAGPERTKIALDSCIVAETFGEKPVRRKKVS